jgi:hypothetical protein
MKNVRVLRVLVLLQAVVILLFVAYVLIWLKANKSTTIAVQADICASAPVDFGVWQGELTVRQNDLMLAQEELERNKERVLRNFTAKGLLAADVEFKGVQTQGDSNYFVLKQKVVVSTSDLIRLKKVSAESGELLKFRIDFSADEPRYRIANFTVWITSQLPLLIENAKQQVQALLQDGQEIERIKKFKMKPVSSKTNNLCIPLDRSIDTHELHVLLEAEIEFLVR